MPAPALAVDQSEPKASPPEEDFATGLLKEPDEVRDGFEPSAGEAVDGAGTEVK